MERHDSTPQSMVLLLHSKQGFSEELHMTVCPSQQDYENGLMR
jgi:hypothetical protein